MFRRIAPVAAALLLGAALAGCGEGPTGVAPVSKTGELVVITREGFTTYYLDPQGKEAGLEFDLVTRFAREIGVQTRFVLVKGLHNVTRSLARHRGHLAAAALPVTPVQAGDIRFGVPYQTVTEQVIYNTDWPKPRGIEDLASRRLEIVQGQGLLERLKDMGSRLPLLGLARSGELDTWDLLGKLAHGDLETVVADSNMFDVARIYYPNLAAAFTIGEPKALAWAFPPNAEPWLVEKAEQFFQHIYLDGTLARLIDRYYGHVRRLENQDIDTFLQRRVSMLPRYRALFQDAERISGVDWRLLAALAYQESHWDPLATSPTNVRGMMMLTEDTADRLGVSNRLEPSQDIPAAARYLVTLRDALAERIAEPDRTWMAIAAYNVGIGHLEDARVLAQRQKLDPNSWTDLKKALPLLARGEYADQLKYGAARGGEAVIMTENIRSYYDILARFEPPLSDLFTASRLSAAAPRPWRAQVPRDAPGAAQRAGSISSSPPM